MELLYHSRNENYKKPFGAVKTGEDIFISFPVLESLFIQSVCLVLRDERREKRVCLNKIKSENGYDVFEANFSAEIAGVYFYRFELIKDDIVRFCGKDVEGNAKIEDWLPEWQLTVYDKDFRTPDFIKGGIIYHIFVDRFYKSGDFPLHIHKRDAILREDWGGKPNLIRNDFFGGNLKGIEEKLPYLRELGVTLIYLSPIFEAASNHRYDTGNYEKIDEILGSEEDLKSLIEKAHSLGIKIILDGVFSHTGSDSVYFDIHHRYGGNGAYNSKKSPYFSWYKFKHYPADYECWWGIQILPNVNELNESYLEYILGENGIIAKWQGLGVDGWRLDVADELPDLFLDRLRQRVKEVNKDALIIGEVWEDASNKQSYGKRRKYLLGSQLDSVMNYPFKDAIIDFLKGGNAKNLAKTVLDIEENYPKPVLDCLMNSISTHDTQRIITVLDGNKLLVKLSALLNFTLIGVPSIYYGDEIGLEGENDPYNRMCFPWGQEDKELLAFYKDLATLRLQNKEAFLSRIEFIKAEEDILVYKRGNVTIAMNRKNGSYEMKIDV